MSEAHNSNRIHFQTKEFGYYAAFTDWERRIKLRMKQWTRNLNEFF